ncbi:MAG: hypothetical protein DHS20C16_18040 [Phycisphaerae bacterium]|nr:MAG: hypothetical protein DHS20C16_18040 [Phycisphaerae bacterium]
MSLRKTDRNILAVDWDARYIRFVHAKLRKGNVRIDRLFSVDVPEQLDVSNAEQLGGMIRDILKQQKIRTDRVILDVPRDKALLTTLKLPMTDPNELPAMVEFQIGKEIPFPLNQAVVDFAMPESSGDGPADVLVGTVRREVVEYYQQTCEQAGLKLARLGLRPYANKEAIHGLFGAGRYECVVMVDVGPRLTEIDVVTNGKLSFSRAGSVSIPKPVAPGSDQLQADSAITTPDDSADSAIIQFPKSGAMGGSSDVDRVVSALVVEVTRTIEAFRSSTPGVNVDMIVVGGSVGLEEHVARALGERYSATVELYNPAAQFGWPEEKGKEARAFSAALGLVTAHAGDSQFDFDFLHPKRTVTAAERRLKKAPVFAIAALVVVSFLVGLYWKVIMPKNQALGDLRTKIDDYEERISDLEKIQDKKIAIADSFDKDQVVWLDELNRMASLLPSNQSMLLKMIDMDAKGAEITMKLEAKNRQTVLDTVEKIDAFRLRNDEDTYFNAVAGRMTEKSSKEQYPTSGSIDVVIERKVEKK